MAEGYFWGLTLQAGEAGSRVWDPENEGGDKEAPFQGEQSLVIKQAVLGAKAKPGEINLVQVEAMGFGGPIKIPIVRLTAGEMSQCRLDLTFPDPPVTFNLVEGNGPVHLVGNINVGDAGHGAPEMDEEIDEEEDELEEEEVNDIQNSKGDNKKRKVPFSAAAHMKKAKLDVHHEAEDDEDDEEDPKKKRGAYAKKEKPKKK